MNAIVPVEEALEPTSEVISILEEFLTKLEAGARLNPEDLTARCPALAEPLKACLASLEFLHDASLSLRDPATPELPAATECQTDLGRLGDFQLVREIGRGGMGVVYEAEQISLGRRVALKVLPFAAALDARQLQRFKNEAQAAACLHHTNIVPVFGVGCERGVHYYAMQYIEGQTLAAIIRNLRRGKDCGLPGFSSGTEQSTCHCTVRRPRRLLPPLPRTSARRRSWACRPPLRWNTLISSVSCIAISSRPTCSSKRVLPSPQGKRSRSRAASACGSPTSASLTAARDKSG